MARILDIRNEVVGFYVRIQCPDCGELFERYQPTLGGIAAGGSDCPECGASCDVSPEDLVESLERQVPESTRLGIERVGREATRICETWYRSSALTGLLSYRSVELGPPTERELLATILRGVYRVRLHTRGAR